MRNEKYKMENGGGVLMIRIDPDARLELQLIFKRCPGVSARWRGLGFH
jgi:hypothetical protein